MNGLYLEVVQDSARCSLPYRCYAGQKGKRVKGETVKESFFRCLPPFRLFAFSPFRLSYTAGRAVLASWAILLLSFCLFCSPVGATVPTTQELEEALTCQCSCGLTVHSCNHLQCGFAVPAKQEVAQQLSQGKGHEEIIGSFVSRYGEKVLSAPTTSGFNLAAWITPFLAVLVGGVLVALVSLRWSRQQTQSEQVLPPASAATDQYRERLKKELDRFDG
jgi:cytochrome c-type biogenesis protein CcmH